MDAKRETKRILGALNSYRKRLGWGSSFALDRKLNRSEGYVRRLLAGKIEMRLEQLFETVGAVGFEAGEFFAWVYGDECRISPERYLLDLEKKVDAPPLLREVDIAIATRLDEKHRETEKISDLLADVRRLEDMRFSFPLQARETGQALVREVISRDFSSVDPFVLCEVLGALGSVERMLEQFSLSAAYLRRALMLADSRRFFKKRKGELFLRSSYLAADQGDLQYALTLASCARDVYTYEHDLSGIGKSLADEGRIYSTSGDLDLAIACFEGALLYLPQDLWRYRVMASYGVAYTLFQRGQFDRSQVCLEHAYKEHVTREGYNWDKMAWLRGELAYARGDLAGAEIAFRSVRSAFAAYGNSLDVALVSLRLCQVLLMSGRVSELMNHIGEMVDLLQPLRGNPVAEGVINDLLRRALAGKITADLLDRAYSRLEKSAEAT